MNILCVDDDPMCRCLLDISLKDAGHDVFLAADSASAAAILAGNTIHAVVVDMRLGGERGSKLIEHICIALPGVTTVLVSGVGAEELRAAAKSCGATAWMQKPVDVELLLRTLGRLRA